MNWKEVPQDWIWDGDPERINAEVRAHMGRRDLTRQQVADIIGVKRQALARRLAGETDWRLSELDKLATAWGIPVDHLSLGSPENSTTVTVES